MLRQGTDDDTRREQSPDRSANGRSRAPAPTEEDGPCRRSAGGASPSPTALTGRVGRVGGPPRSLWPGPYTRFPPSRAVGAHHDAPARTANNTLRIRPQGIVLEIQFDPIRRDTALSARFCSCRRGGPCGRPHFPFRISARFLAIRESPLRRVRDVGAKQREGTSPSPTA